MQNKIPQAPFEGYVYYSTAVGSFFIFQEGEWKQASNLETFFASNDFPTFKRTFKESCPPEKTEGLLHLIVLFLCFAGLLALAYYLSFT